MVRVMLRSGVRSPQLLLDRMGQSRHALSSPFGPGTANLFRAFPRLSALVRPEDLIWNHTTSPLLVAFSGRVTSDSDREAFCSAVLQSNAWRRGGRSCHCLRPRGLRECHSCREEDIRAYGVAYWHREHQVRPVSRCWRHDVPLLEHVWCPGTGFELELPGFGRYAADAPAVNMPPMSSGGLDLWMAKAVASALAAPSTSDAHARQLLAVEAAEAGLCAHGVPQLKKIHVQMLETVGVPYLQSLGYSTEYSQTRGARFARPLTRRKSALDPVLTLLLAASLGLHHDALVSPLKPQRALQPVARPPVHVLPVDGDERTRIKEALEANGYVLSRAAASLGVSWSVLTTMIGKHGIVCPIVTSTNAKFDKATIEAMILAMKCGEVWASLKKRFGCGDHHLGTLKIYDATLLEAASTAQRQRLIEAYRRAVAHALASHPRPSRGEIRMRLVTEVSYLDHHDRAWLRSQLDQLPRRRRVPSKPRRDFVSDQALDRVTVAALHHAVGQAMELQPPRQLTRALLLRLGGISASIYPKLTTSRLPETCALLAANEEPSESYFVRRIEYALTLLAGEARPVTLIRLRRASGLTEPRIVENKALVQRLVAASGLPVSPKAVVWLQAGNRESAAR